MTHRSTGDWLAQDDDDDETAATVLMNDHLRAALIAEDALTPTPLDARFEAEAQLDEGDGSLAGEVAPAEPDASDPTVPLLVLGVLSLVLMAAVFAIAPLLLL